MDLECVEFTAFNNHWGDAPEWQRTVYLPIPSIDDRIAALEAGEVDLVQTIPADRAAALEKAGFRRFDLESDRTMFFNLWMGFEQPEINPAEPNNGPFIVYSDDLTPVEVNLFSDARAREAVSLAIDREIIVRDIMDGGASPAGQMMQPGQIGFVGDVGVPQVDVNAAAALMADVLADLQIDVARGLTITLHGPNNRYPNDGDTLTEVAAQLTAAFANVGAGVTFLDDSFPLGTFEDENGNTREGYFGRLFSDEFIGGYLGWGSDTALPFSPLTALFTSDAPLNVTGFAGGGFSSAEFPELDDPRSFDERVADAATNANDSERDRLIEGVIRQLIEEQPVVPVMYIKNSWASRAGLVFTPDKTALTIPQRVSVSPY